MWEFFEQLLSQLPSRDFVQNSISGAFDRAVQSFRSASSAVKNQANRVFASNRESDDAYDERQSGLDESRAKLNRLQKMLDGLKTSSEEGDLRKDHSPTHVIVDNHSEIKGDADTETNPPDEVSGVFQRFMKQLDSLQSDEWKSKTDAERSAAYDARFGKEDAGEFQKFLDKIDARFTEYKNKKSKEEPYDEEHFKFVWSFPKSQQKKASQAWWRKETNRRLKEVSAGKPDRWEFAQSFGRRLQMWGGRFSAMGGRVPSMLGRGLGRAGMALQGIGRAGAMAGGGLGAMGTAGAAVGVFAVAVTAAVASVYAFVKGSSAAGEGLLEQQRKYASMSGGQAQAMGLTTLNQLQNDIRTAQGTEMATMALAQEMSEFRDAMQPIDQLVTNLELVVVSKLVDAATAVVNGLNSLGDPMIELAGESAKWMAWIQGGNRQQQAMAEQFVEMGLRAARGVNNRPGRAPIDQILQNLRNAPPAAPRPPIQPIP